MSIPSFQRFDYGLRANKAIERKLVFDLALSAKKNFTLVDLWYLGFGSMWFSDFKIAHRTLHVDDMISIERQAHAPRAEFNRPFSTIKVLAGECGELLKEGIAAALWERPVMAWLDYDGRMDETVIGDIDMLLAKAKRNSIVAITINGARGSYRPKPTAIGASPQSPKTGLGVVAQFLGKSAVPKEFVELLDKPGVAGDVSDLDFPRFLAEAISNYMWHRVFSLSRAGDEGDYGFQPLFLMHHKDNADMVTVGGALIAEHDREAWRDVLRQQEGLADSEGNPRYCRMDLAPVTLREKITLDRYLPTSKSSDEYKDAVTGEGVRLDANEVEKYRRFYRQFPVFMEAAY
ncbi:O-methyltransferase [Stenotrophomonas sp. MMGLT7]|uniref:O-methyltransferase n=1 Tax=Stenotrophomonas sp. MMGLT7 TaxID=2901227 RepID=UPI001E3BEF7F|nr:O-methyltransferase [Stenotrophomonas sp. MMGLT7]MCD7097851.1 hypothetical protein [Stenotrophomonas sp. MMGLT7]